MPVMVTVRFYRNCCGSIYLGTKPLPAGVTDLTTGGASEAIIFTIKISAVRLRLYMAAPSFETANVMSTYFSPLLH